MREYKEVFIDISPPKAPEDIADEVESIAQRLHKDGWFYIESRSDSLLQSLWLFFERDLNL
jgi:hypothetical protein